MDHYLDQLIQDIDHIINKKPAAPSEIWDGVNLDNDAEVEDISYIEQYLSGVKNELQHIVGIAKESLPPADQLNDKQIAKLFQALVDLLEYHHYELSYPADFSNRIKYELLYNKWDKKQPKVTHGFVGIEFCNYDESECPVPGKCRVCADFRIEAEQGGEHEHNNEHSPQDILPSKKEIEKFVLHQKTEKVKNTIENLKPKAENITGIFNYCDRWCEKCLFTDRCTNYQFEKELGLYDENVDKEELIDDVSAILAGTLSFLKSKMEELDIDISDYQGAEAYENNKAAAYPLSLKAKEYMTNLSDWFEENYDYLSDTASKLWNSSQNNFMEFNDQLEIIGWYMTIIPVKIVRALNPKDELEDEEFYQYDRNGTGKVVLVSIDKSIAAFSILFEKLSKKQDEILDFLNTLSKIKTAVEKEIPDARKFIRPGLDE